VYLGILVPHPRSHHINRYLSGEVSIVPSLQVPTNVWLTATPDERDAFYLQAGFDPNLPILDNGTDTQFVRFIQVESGGAGSIDAPAFAHSGGTAQDHRSQHPSHHQDPSTGPFGVPQAGDDLRDFQTVGFTPENPGNGRAPASAGVGLIGLSVAGRALRLIMGGGGGRLTAAIWNSLPGSVRAVLVQVGIGVGALIAFNGDIPFITLPGQSPDLPAPVRPPVDIQVGSSGGHVMHGAEVVGSWNTNPKDPANGVTFYRLANGWLAVQNKKGRWKTWKPKKPIVLYAAGATDLKTMLRADKALNKQAKKLAAMLNRRAPRRKSAAVAAPAPIILGNNARVVDV